MKPDWTSLIITLHDRNITQIVVTFVGKTLQGISCRKSVDDIFGTPHDLGDPVQWFIQSEAKKILSGWIGFEPWPIRTITLTIYTTGDWWLFSRSNGSKKGKLEI